LEELKKSGKNPKLIELSNSFKGVKKKILPTRSIVKEMTWEVFGRIVSNILFDFRK